jgi:lipopolysaccharide/colanic/teichoic acid biosynthesis glycosyltransferase
MMDVVISFPLALASLVFYPFVIAARKIEGYPVFIYQERVGKNQKPIRIMKFGSMTVSDGGVWVTKSDNRITKVGAFLRKSRIDELPQLWNILRGDLSLIGPRPELPNLVELYKKEIPHYNVRHLIKPGLSGWAQIHHEKPPHSIEETVDKLSYDLYYVKHRSFLLDLKIALQTVKTLLSRVGM